MARQPRLRFICAALFWWLAHVGGMAAECGLRLELDNVEWHGGTRGGYDVFDPGEYPQTIFFKVHLTGDPCPFFVTFSKGNQGIDRRLAISGAESLEYEIYDSVDRRTVLKDLPAANSNEIISGFFQPGETAKSLSYTIVTPPLQIRPSGHYTDVFQVTVYQGTPEDFIERDSRTISFSIPVEEVIELSLGSTGASFDPRAKARVLDFDRLDQGKAKRFDLRVRGNSGYRVLLESENGGVMKNIDSPAGGSIPYSLHAGGASVNLSGGRQEGLSRRNRLTARDGDRHELEVTIGDMTGATAGTYRDNITITVISDN